jgi:group I intron endonuclease
MTFLFNKFANKGVGLKSIFIMQNNFSSNNGHTLPVIVYSNANTDKSTILLDNKNRTGIYQWTHKESGKIYVGSAVNLSKRLNNYFNENYLNHDKNMYICNALLLHGHSAFSLTILEYIDISNLTKEDARKLILGREQHYIDSLEPTYNKNPIAGSSLGSQHTLETIEKISKALTGKNNSMYGKQHTKP